MSLERVSDRFEKRRIVEGLLAASPGFPVAWKELAVLADDDQAILAAINRGLASRPDPETRGILLMNKAVGLARLGDRAAAVQILGSLATDPASSLATEHLAKAALARLIDKR